MKLPQEKEYAGRGRQIPSIVKPFFVILFLVCIDLIAFGFAYLLAFYTRSLLSLFEAERFSGTLSLNRIFPLWWTPFVFVFFIAYERLYTYRLPFWDEARSLIKSVSVSMVIILSAVNIYELSYGFSRLKLVLFWIFAIFIFPTFRLWGKRCLSRLGWWNENVIIIGAGTAGKAVAQALNSDAHMGFNLVGFLDDSPDKIASMIEINGREYKVFGRVRNYKKFVSFLNISSVIIAIPSLRPDKLTKLANSIQKYTKQVLLIPDLKGLSLLNTELRHLFEQQMFLLKINNNLKNFVTRFFKRVSDIALSLMLFPFVVPVICLIWIMLKLDSGGPAFFVQDRLGRKGVFKCIKFRTMHQDSDKLLADHLQANPAASEEWEKYKKLRDYDPRVTKIGKWLRNTSLDELPQLFNVLKGDMSLVGPRPYMPSESKDIGDSIETILLINPGITGLWQVSGRNGLSFQHRIELDKWYILNWSLWFDIVILCKTLGVVIKRQGAY